MIIGMTAAENIAVNPIMEYQAATIAMDIDDTNVIIDNFMFYLY
jgi:hypothetical protein|tara:strand:+ start:1927 stop:2058 length:132 start_codon:yes stop_codon:yes gene_type:complete